MQMMQLCQIPEPCLHPYFQKDFSSHNVCQSGRLPHTKIISKGQRKPKKRDEKRRNMKKENSLSTGDHENMKVIDGLGKEQPPTTEVLQQEESSVGREMEMVSAQIRASQKNSNLCQNGDLLTDKLADYAQPIYTYLTQKQLSSILPTLNHSSQANHFIRAKIVDWLFKVSNIFNFKSQTSFLAIHIIDRVMNSTSFPHYELQLLTITCLYLAAKYEQVMVPKLCSFLALASEDFRISKANVLQLEGRIISHLNFDFSYVSPSTFIDLIAYQFHLSKEHKQKALNVCIQAIIQPQFSSWSPSNLGWYSLYKGCPQAQPLQQFIRKNEELSFGKGQVKGQVEA